jgi:ATP-dependent 26S proteasome regulatory subunit
MDGLREDADTFFILTTNRPETLEAALAQRPGRIDQAIEFPLPDKTGRERLVDLYAGKLTVPARLREKIVKQTEGVSASFIKELMRRTAQYSLESGKGKALAMTHVNAALEEMLFVGGALNAKLLGGSASTARAE